MSYQQSIKIEQEWDIVSARQLGRAIAKDMGFSTVDQARITTAISELARNIYLYAGNGTISFEIVNEFNRKGMCLIAMDEGPGIDNLSDVMQDGYTTSGGLGAGLPGAKRLMDTFDLRSEVDKGTEIKAIKWIDL